MPDRQVVERVGEEIGVGDPPMRRVWTGTGWRMWEDVGQPTPLSTDTRPANPASHVTSGSPGFM